MCPSAFSDFLFNFLVVKLPGNVLFGKAVLCKGTEYFSKSTNSISTTEQPVAVASNVEELLPHYCNQQVNGGVERDPKRLTPISASDSVLVQSVLIVVVVSQLPIPVLPVLNTNNIFPLCNMNLPCFSSSPFLLALCTLDINQGLLPFLLAAAFYIQEECHRFLIKLNSLRSFNLSFTGYLL